jgi:hypothetical protein
MTGPWQVLGRNTIQFDEMVRLDYLYVTNWSLANDLKTRSLVLARCLPPCLPQAENRWFAGRFESRMRLLGLYG